MGFSNVTYHDRIENMNSLQKSKLKNPYYAFTEAAKSIVTYYHINEPKTTLDMGTHGMYDYVDEESGFRFDKIKLFPLYGLDRFIPDLEIGDTGMASRPIEGDGLILPNTIKPSPNDCFLVDYVNKKFIFRITNVNMNVLENDNVMYKVSYILDSTRGEEALDKQVINTYTCMNTGEMNPTGDSLGSGSLIINGTSVTPAGSNASDFTGAGDINSNYKLIIESDGLNSAKDLNTLAFKFTMWYIELFYNDKLEAFILKHRNQYLYDEYLTEFIIRNRIISANEHKIHVMHQTNLPRTFSIDYENTVLRFVESKKFTIFDYTIKAYPEYIDDLGSTLANRYYDFYRMKYIFDQNIYGEKYVLSVLDNSMLSFIERREFKEDPSLGYWNIIIKYLKGMELNIKDTKYLQKIQCKHNIEFYYNLPILIFILRNWSNSLINSKTLK